MDFRLGEKEEKLRSEIRDFVKKELPTGHGGGMFEEEHYDEGWKFAMSISKKLSEKGWLTMSWPKEYGGMGASHLEQAVYAEEVGYWGIPGTGMGIGGVAWVGPSLILFGTEEQKKKYMPQIAAGEPGGVWCTGYSEPDAGSDFASLRTRAERKGDKYVINGQKVWTSAGHRADWCWLAAKTDQNVQKKHHGISIIIVDMKSKGITVRPIINYVGLHILNEVFFEDVEVPVENLVGEENRGWYQLMRALSFERSGAVSAYGSSKRLLDELVNYCKESGLIQKQDIRQKLADITVDMEVLKVLGYEVVWKMNEGKNVTYEPSRNKAFNDIFRRELTTVASEIIGAYSQVDFMNKGSLNWAKLSGRIEKHYTTFPGLATAAGTTDKIGRAHV